MDQIEEVSPDLQSVKGENAIIVRLKDGFKETKIILTNQVCYSHTNDLWFSKRTKKIESCVSSLFWFFLLLNSQPIMSLKLYQYVNCLGRDFTKRMAHVSSNSP